MRYVALPAFMTDLRRRDATAARALEFAILTAARSGEVLGARWDEFDLDRAVWTVPATRMKGGREHRVPLSRRALKIVKAMKEFRESDFVFRGQNPGKPLSVMALAMVLRRMKLVSNRPWLLFLVSRLGVGMHQFHERDLRSSTGACD